jgi:hypothetical protein
MVLLNIYNMLSKVYNPIYHYNFYELERSLRHIIRMLPLRPAAAITSFFAIVTTGDKECTCVFHANIV